MKGPSWDDGPGNAERILERLKDSSGVGMIDDEVRDFIT